MRHAAAIVPNGAWTVYHRDDGHTGNDPTLPLASTATTGWTSPVLDAEVFAEPLVYGGLVYVATLNNSVYALNQADGTVVWHSLLGAPKVSGWTCGNVAPQGILGTPVIDVAGGDKLPRKGGPGITRSDLLVINKTDLAPYVGADLDRMAADVATARPASPSLFISLVEDPRAEPVAAFVEAWL